MVRFGYDCLLIDFIDPLLVEFSKNDKPDII